MGNSKAYTTELVERLLQNMLHIRNVLEGGLTGEQPDNQYIRKPMTRDNQQELPLGMAPNDPRGWPFREPQHAKEPFDGKAKAITTQELHCCIIDIEEAFDKKDGLGNYIIDDDDIDLLTKYHICQTHTLADLALERNVTSRGSMQRRVLRAVRRLVSVMEQT